MTEVSTPALKARAVVATVPADADTLSSLPADETLTNVIDDANDFVTRHAGILNSRRRAFFGESVAVAHTAGLNLDADVSGTRRRNFTLDDLEVRSGSGNLRHFHRCDCDLRRYHVTSRTFRPPC
jgi:hypothetical protein